MREGSAEVIVACPVETAFAWLSDPRNAGEWFASVTLPEPPERPLRVGTTWRFNMTRQRGKNIPMRLAEYQPPRSFAWETEYPAWRDNLRWTLVLSPEEPETQEEREAGAGPRTLLRMTIRQQPGPLGWPLVALAALIGRLGATEGASIAARAERAAVRAGEALEALPTLPPRGQRSGKGRGGIRR